MTYALTGTEVLQILPIQSNGYPSATTVQVTTAQIAALAATEETGLIDTAITTVGNGTLTAAGLVGGQISRTGPVANYSDTTATAAAIVAALPGFVVNQTFLIRIKNGTAFTQTILAGTGVTLPATILVPPFSNGNYFATVTSATTVTLTHMNTTMASDGIFNTVPVSGSLVTVGAGTILAASIAGGSVTRTGSQSGTAFTDTTDTAAAIIAAAPNLANKIGTAMYITYINSTNATATITGGTGVTVSGLTVIPPNNVATFLTTYTAAATLTMVGVSVMQASASGVTVLGSSTGSTAIASANAGATNYTATLPANTGTIAELNLAQTFTAAQTFTNSDILLLGSSTGANTFTALNASATNYTTSVPAVTGVLASTSGANLYINDLKRCSATVTASGTSLVNVTGLSFTVVPGTYKFRCVLQGVADGTGGIKYAFNYTTTALTSIQATGQGATAAAVATQSTTTTTTQALIFDQAAAVLQTIIEGTMVVSTGGTIDVQAGQHANSGSSTIVIGSTAEFIRIA